MQWAADAGIRKEAGTASLHVQLLEKLVADALHDLGSGVEGLVHPAMHPRPPGLHAGSGAVACREPRGSCQGPATHLQSVSQSAHLCPKPMSLKGSLLSLALLIASGMLSFVPIDSSILMTASLAPPCAAAQA